MIKFSFSLDYDGDIEYIEVLDGNITEEQGGQFVNDLIEKGLLILSDHRTEGEVTHYPDKVEVFERRYTQPDWDYFEDRTFEVSVVDGKLD